MANNNLNDLILALDTDPSARYATLDFILSLVKNSSQDITKALVTSVARFLDHSDPILQHKAVAIIKLIQKYAPSLVSSSVTIKLHAVLGESDKEGDTMKRSLLPQDSMSIADKTVIAIEREVILPDKKKRDEPEEEEAEIDDSFISPQPKGEKIDGIKDMDVDVTQEKVVKFHPVSAPAPAPASSELSSTSRSTISVSRDESSTRSGDTDKAEDKTSTSLSKKSKRKKTSRLRRSDMPSIGLDRLADPQPNTSLKSKGYATVDYFDQMNPNKVYAVNIALSKGKIEVKTKQRDIFTGETKKQIQEAFEVDYNKKIDVELNFPGCLVTPSSQTVILREDKKVLTYFVTPLAKGSITGQIRLLQDNHLVLSLAIKYKVLDQRIASLLAKIGLAISAIPLFFTYILGINPNDLLIEQFGNFGSSLTSPLLLGIELLLTVIFIFGALFFYRRYQGKRKSMTANPF